MLFIIIENNKIVSKLDYKPNVPENTNIIEYTENIPKEFIELIDGKICDSRNYIFYQGKYIPVTGEIKEQIRINKEAKDFLTNTDWKVLRHLEQQEKNISTSLTQEDYQALLNERQKFRESIKE
jgi:hypothetical protein